GAACGRWAGPGVSASRRSWPGMGLGRNAVCSTVYYSLTSPHVAELLRVARTILSGVLAGQAELLADLQAAQAEGKPPS
ncbi:hypothetical protein ACWD4N_40070, partial [Streptomyces sp. NPDC002586]